MKQRSEGWTSLFAVALCARVASAEITTDGSFGPAQSIPAVSNQYQITEEYGRRSGVNLFHSFSLFNVEGRSDVGGEHTATFSAMLPTERVIARVTGGTRSQINGVLRSALNADLFLLNPAGVTFGADAILDLGGSFHVSTAGLLRFESGPDFDATSAAPDPPLSIAAPSAFGFVTDAPEVIRFTQTVDLKLPAGETFSLVGGAVLMNGRSRAIIRYPGRVQIAAVDRASDVPLDLTQFGGDALAAAVTVDEIPDVSLVEGFLDVGGTVNPAGPAGQVVIRGGSLVFAGGRIDAAHRSAMDAAPAIDIEMVNGVDLSAMVNGDGLSATSRLSSQSFGAGRGGLISIDAPQVSVREGSLVRALAAGTGEGGAIVIHADRVFVSNATDHGTPASITTQAFGEGRGGDLTLEVRDLELERGGSVSTEAHAGGAGGNLAVVGADRVRIHGVDSPSAQNPQGRRASLRAVTALGSSGVGGTLDLAARIVEVENGGQISTLTQGTGNANALTIDASERLTVMGGEDGTSNISADSRRLGEPLPGGGGDLTVRTGLLELKDGGQISASTEGMLDSGLIHVEADEVVVSGKDPSVGNASGLFSRSNANLDDGGDARGIEIVATGDVLLSDQSILSSSTIATGNAGPIGVEAGGRIALETGATINAVAEGFFTGNGGSVELTAAQGVFLSNGSSILAEAHGEGLAGDVTIEAGPRFEASDSTVETEARRGSGGRITIIADEIIWLRSSSLTTSVLEAEGGGGDIDIDPEFVVLDQSRIEANAVGGDGGDITITAGTFFATPDSVVKASSELGIDGTISIIAPDTDVTSGITTLPTGVLDATALMRNACSAATAEGGSFVVAARPGLPVSPDALLAAFDERTTQAAVSAAPASAAEMARVALADEIPAGGCRRASNEVL